MIIFIKIAMIICIISGMISLLFGGGMIVTLVPVIISDLEYPTWVTTTFFISVATFVISVALLFVVPCVVDVISW